jgi:hypothetical protein
VLRVATLFSFYLRVDNASLAGRTPLRPPRRVAAHHRCLSACLPAFVVAAGRRESFFGYSILELVAALVAATRFNTFS